MKTDRDPLVIREMQMKARNYEFTLMSQQKLKRELRPTATADDGKALSCLLMRGRGILAKKAIWMNLLKLKTYILSNPEAPIV